MAPETIRERAEAIRLGNKPLAAKTGLAEHTVGRALKRPSGGNIDTYRAIENAVVTEELRLRDYLLTLHPLQSQPGEAA